MNMRKGDISGTVDELFGDIDESSESSVENIPPYPAEDFVEPYEVLPQKEVRGKRLNKYVVGLLIFTLCILIGMVIYNSPNLFYKTDKVQHEVAALSVTEQRDIVDYSVDESFSKDGEIAPSEDSLVKKQWASIMAKQERLSKDGEIDEVVESNTTVKLTSFGQTDDLVLTNIEPPHLALSDVLRLSEPVTPAVDVVSIKKIKPSKNVVKKSKKSRLVKRSRTRKKRINNSKKVMSNKTLKPKKRIAKSKPKKIAQVDTNPCATKLLYACATKRFLKSKREGGLLRISDCKMLCVANNCQTY